VPHLYFWKSAKWVRGLKLREGDEPGTKSIVLDLPDWPGHRAGQYVDIRLAS
jgi:DMSO/TMAO reductase YedYZ molybdopterin-dependent catalytic subunit